MQGGMDFHEHVESLLDGCDVLLAIIGKSWTSMTDADGNRRLDDPEDLVRREIARALQRPDVEVIPVLVDGALMPKEHELPPDLAPLARRQACELADSRWDYDVDTLARRLRVLLGENPRRWRPGARVIGIGLAVAVVGGLLALWPSIKPQGVPATKAARLTHLSLDRDITFGQYLDRKELSRKPYTASVLGRRGAYVAFDFRVEGYRGKRLPLRWQLIDARTGDQLDQSRDVSITPDATTDQGSWDVWVPYRGGTGGCTSRCSCMTTRGSCRSGGCGRSGSRAPGCGEDEVARGGRSSRRARRPDPPAVARERYESVDALPTLPDVVVEQPSAPRLR